MNCQRCGAPVSEDPSRELLTCEHCSSAFTTPEHDALYKQHLEAQKAEKSLLLERERLTMERDEKRLAREQEARQQGHERRARTASGIGAAGARVSLVVLGLVVLAYASPLIAQYGFLRQFAGGLLPKLRNTPLIGALYPFPAAVLRTFYFQMFVGLLVAVSIILFRVSVRVRRR